MTKEYAVAVFLNLQMNIRIFPRSSGRKLNLGYPGIEKTSALQRHRQPKVVHAEGTFSSDVRRSNIVIIKWREIIPPDPGFLFFAIQRPLVDKTL